MPTFNPFVLELPLDKLYQGRRRQCLPVHHLMRQRLATHPGGEVPYFLDFFIGAQGTKEALEVKPFQ
jgi:hypothetical protein